QTVRSLLEDLAGGPGPDDPPLPRPGLLRYPAGDGGPGDSGPGDGGPGDGESPLAALLASRGIRTVTYQDWLRIEAAEAALGEALGRGGRVKLAGPEALHRACFPPEA